MKKHRIYSISLASVYPHYIAKAEKKLEARLKSETDLETFFTEAPRPNPSRSLIKGVICGIRVEDIEEPIMREIRYMDKLIDELARGKSMEKILRTPSSPPS